MGEIQGTTAPIQVGPRHWPACPLRLPRGEIYRSRLGAVCLFYIRFDKRRTGYDNRL